MTLLSSGAYISSGRCLVCGGGVSGLQRNGVWFGAGNAIDFGAMLGSIR